MGMKVFFDLCAMPSVSERERSFFFRLMANTLKMRADNDFHWILYSVYRDSCLLSLLFAIFIIVRLLLVDVLTDDIVISSLRFFTVGSSIPILFFVLPYYFLKTKKMIGFSKIDYTRQFSSRIKMKRGDAYREMIIRKGKVVIPLIIAGLPLGWISISMVLKHYDALLSLNFVGTIILIYGLLATPTLSFVSVCMVFVYLQYKHHYDEIPNTEEPQTEQERL